MQSCIHTVFVVKFPSVIKMSKQLKGSLSIILATVIWGSTFVAQSVGVDYMGPFTFLSLRCFLAVAMLLAVLFLRNRKEFVKIIADPRLWKAGIPCGVALFAATALQQIGLIYTTAGKGGFITTMYIIMVPILGLFLKRKPPKMVGLSVVIAAVGLYLISGAGFTAINIGDVLMLLCAVAFAVQILIMDRVAGELNSMALNMSQALVCAVISGICALIFDSTTWQGILDCWFPLCWAGIMSMGIAYTLQIVGQKAIEPTTASLLMSFESVFAAISGWLLLSESFTLTEGIGCVLVFAAIMLTQIPVKDKK
ncbi:MAG: DMT family transporter [Ruminococcaceae bacterium]|nr:DMT family transporter [Oscillospiraceae bacterium]